MRFSVLFGALFIADSIKPISEAHGLICGIILILLAWMDLLELLYDKERRK